MDENGDPDGSSLVAYGQASGHQPSSRAVAVTICGSAGRFTIE